ncbi:MAG TPA: hypothetical protein ENI19_03355 [Candidatus Nealsonbacteria bacterium]|nr:hypothetical protein [Candidatus Nealsonbacteria bacterium]HEB46717.1 hypothetical protein [Candidatus Nealsonbacteria bacterium]
MAPKGRKRLAREKQAGQAGKIAPKPAPKLPKKPDFIILVGGQILFFLCQIKKEMVKPKRTP